MKKMIKCILLLALVPVFSIAQAQNTNTNTNAYVKDNYGEVVKSNFGLCWRTSSWTPQTATRDCDPELFKEDVISKKVEIIKTPELKQEAVVKTKQVVNIILKEFFEFNKSELSQVNKDKLKEVAEKIKTFNVEVITVSGYTDRIGTEKYNQNLSEKRANVVKEELIKLGIEKDRLYTEAKGENEPVVNCKGKTTAKVIACLAPNRRVEIEIVGSNK